MSDEVQASESSMASQGGKVAAANMTPAERKERAKKAAAARWAGDLPRATHGSLDRPLRIGGVAIPCYVIQSGDKVMRVIVQAGMIEAMGMAKGGSSHRGGTRLAKFAAGDRIKPFVSEELIRRTQTPIRFVTTGGTIAFGFEADILAELCEAVIEAKNQDQLQPQQLHIAEQCWILYRGFARVGIDALIDEATGYQYDRVHDALTKILEAFVAKELRKWVKTFPPEFYQELFRLRGLEYTPKARGLRYIGHLTNDLVYSRLAPGVLAELRNKNPVTEKGYRRSKHHQWLTDHTGHPKLVQHLDKLVAMMKMFDTWDEFTPRLDRAIPKYQEMPLFDWVDKQPDRSSGTAASIPSGNAEAPSEEEPAATSSSTEPALLS